MYALDAIKRTWNPNVHQKTELHHKRRAFWEKLTNTEKQYILNPKPLRIEITFEGKVNDYKGFHEWDLINMD